MSAKFEMTRIAFLVTVMVMGGAAVAACSSSGGSDDAQAGGNALSASGKTDVGVIAVDGSLSFADLEVVMQQQEELLGPLTKVANDGTNTTLTFNGALDAPTTHLSLVPDEGTTPCGVSALVAKGTAIVLKKKRGVAVCRGNHGLAAEKEVNDDLVGIDGKLSLSDLMLTLQQQEEILGPSNGITNDGTNTLATFNEDLQPLDPSTLTVVADQGDAPCGSSDVVAKGEAMVAQQKLAVVCCRPATK